MSNITNYLNNSVHNYYSVFQADTPEAVESCITETFLEIAEMDLEYFIGHGSWYLDSGLYAYVTTDKHGDASLYVGTNEGEGEPLAIPARELENRWMEYFHSDEHLSEIEELEYLNGVDAEREARAAFFGRSEHKGAYADIKSQFLDGVNVRRFCDPTALFTELQKASEASEE
jgi:hypothetical protein